jgi:hypothetical protein
MVSLLAKGRTFGALQTIMKSYDVRTETLEKLRLAICVGMMEC